LLAQAGNGVGDADRALELLQHAKDLGAVRPRAGVSDVKVIAAGFGRKAGGAVGGDAVAEYAVDALEIAGLAGLLRQFFVAPLAVEQDAHQAASPRASAAAFRIAAMLAR
jgi:hypothetical protein